MARVHRSRLAIDLVLVKPPAACLALTPRLPRALCGYRCSGRCSLPSASGSSERALVPDRPLPQLLAQGFLRVRTLCGGPRTEGKTHGPSLRRCAGSWRSTPTSLACSVRAHPRTSRRPSACPNVTAPLIYEGQAEGPRIVGSSSQGSLYGQGGAARAEEHGQRSSPGPAIRGNWVAPLFRQNCWGV